MKLSQWYRSQSGQTWLMVAVIVMLIVMIVTRWSYISRTAGEAFRQRFTPRTEHADSLAAQADSLSATRADSLQK